MIEELDLLQKLMEIQKNGLAALEAALDESTLQAWRTAHLGRSAPVMQVFSSLPQVQKELRPQVGQSNPSMYPRRKPPRKASPTPVGSAIWAGGTVGTV